MPYEQDTDTRIHTIWCGQHSLIDSVFSRSVIIGRLLIVFDCQVLPIPYASRPNNKLTRCQKSLDDLEIRCFAASSNWECR